MVVVQGGVWGGGELVGGSALNMARVWYYVWGPVVHKSDPSVSMRGDGEVLERG